MIGCKRVRSELITESMIKRIFLVSILTCFISILGYGQDGKIAGIPQEITVHEGHVFDILVMVEPGSEPVSVVDYVLTYNPDNLSVLSVEMAGSCPLNLNPVETQINNETGNILYSAFKLNEPWPETTFPLLRIQILALSPINQTALHHSRDGQPRTLLAYAGKDMLSIAPDIVVKVLPPVSPMTDDVLMDSNKLNVDFKPENKTCEVSFSVSENDDLKLKLLSKENGVDETLYENAVQYNTTYDLLIDTSILKAGKYKVELSSLGFSSAQSFTVSD